MIINTNDPLHSHGHSIISSVLSERQIRQTGLDGIEFKFGSSSIRLVREDIRILEVLFIRRTA